LSDRQAGYLSRYQSGELERRVERLEARLASCDICPRHCGVNRLSGEVGFCESARFPIVPSVCDHYGEEPVISGDRGSGTIFFANCNLRCVYCQNHQISQNPEHQRRNEMTCEELAQRMVHLQNNLGCHNVNCVSPSHFVPQLLRALWLAVPMGLRVPLVYNTNAYDDVATLRELDGLVDIYLPDIKYASDICAVKYSQARGYVGIARRAIKEMHRQVGDLQCGADGLAQSGLIVRHLVLPNDIGGSADSFAWLASEVSRNVTISLMSQYSPCHRAHRVPLLSRRISGAEYWRAAQAMENAGLENGWMQEPDSPDGYIPDFSGPRHPFHSSVC
jgi:putative pyruvate formate lyase activating enzyme